jgi:hypothetical protein
MQFEIAKVDIMFTYAIFTARLGDSGSEKVKAKAGQTGEVVRLAAEDIANEAFGEEYVRSNALALSLRVEPSKMRKEFSCEDG